MGLVLAATLSPLSPSPSAGAEILPHTVHAQLTLLTVYRGAEQTLRRSGLIYAATIVATSSYLGQKSTMIGRVWVDIVHDIGRTESQFQTPRGKLTQYRIDTPHGSFIRFPPFPAYTFGFITVSRGTRGAGAAAFALLPPLRRSLSPRRPCSRRPSPARWGRDRY